MVAMVGGITTASTTIETPVTLASMRVALLGLLVALAIVDCTEAAIAGVVWMLTPTTTLADKMVNSTADGSTLAWVAIAFFISVCTFGVNEEMSPSSKRDNATTLIAGGEGGGGEGGGGEGEGGGGEGGGGTAGNATTSGNATSRRRSMIPSSRGSLVFMLFIKFGLAPSWPIGRCLTGTRDLC